MVSGDTWIAADWGTTHLRVWHMSADGAVLNEARSAKGMAALSSEEFEPALLEIVSPWLKRTGTTQVVACGMVGARQGWVEADYVEVPAAPLSSGKFKSAPVNDQRLHVSIVPGLKQVSPADVMRGEETQVAGFLSTRPTFEGTLCMPGTHTKWVEIRDGQIQSFASSMTGELFSLISRQTVLKHSVSDDASDDDAFEVAAKSVIDSGRSGLSSLFSIRATDLLHGQSPEQARGKLSGLLIGTEVADQKAHLGKSVMILGEPHLAALYQKALKIAGVGAECLAAADLTLDGLRAAHGQLNGEMTR